MLKYLIPFAVFAVIVGLFAQGLGKDTKLLPSPFVGKPAPSIAVARLDDPEKQFTNADLLGKVSLVNIWASWCATCEHEHPLLNYLSRSVDVHLVGVNYKDKRQDALAWLQRHGNPYHAIPADENGRVGINWGVYGTPESFIIDKQGIVRYKHVGAIDEKSLKEIILPMIRTLQTEEKG